MGAFNDGERVCGSSSCSEMGNSVMTPGEWSLQSIRSKTHKISLCEGIVQSYPRSSDEVAIPCRRCSPSAPTGGRRDGKRLALNASLEKLCEQAVYDQRPQVSRTTDNRLWLSCRHFHDVKSGSWMTSSSCFCLASIQTCPTTSVRTRTYRTQYCHEVCGSEHRFVTFISFGHSRILVRHRWPGE